MQCFRYKIVYLDICPNFLVCMRHLLHLQNYVQTIPQCMSHDVTEGMNQLCIMGIVGLDTGIKKE